MRDEVDITTNKFYGEEKKEGINSTMIDGVDITTNTFYGEERKE
jgi:hypothetical protein